MLGLRVICWLRGDPEGIRVVRFMRGLLARQGIHIVLPEPGSSVSCDSVVLGVESSMLNVDFKSGVVVVEVNAWRSLFKAIEPSGFNTVRIGVDPGALCSIAVYADNLLVWIEKLECAMVASRVKWLIEVIEPRSYTLSVGSGPGYEILAMRLLEEGLNFRIVPEHATSRKPLLSKLEDIGDEDILAAMTIALTT